MRRSHSVSENIGGAVCLSRRFDVDDGIADPGADDRVAKNPPGKNCEGRDRGGRDVVKVEPAPNRPPSRRRSSRRPAKRSTSTPGSRRMSPKLSTSADDRRRTAADAQRAPRLHARVPRERGRTASNSNASWPSSATPKAARWPPSKIFRRKGSRSKANSRRADRVCGRFGIRSHTSRPSMTLWLRRRLGHNRRPILIECAKRSDQIPAREHHAHFGRYHGLHDGVQPPPGGSPGTARLLVEAFGSQRSQNLMC